jgi:hypothetical protein
MRGMNTASLDNSRKLNNNAAGNLNILYDATLTNKDGGELNNYGMLVTQAGGYNPWYGENVPDGLIDNKSGATLNNSGLLTTREYGKLTNRGILNNNAGGTLSSPSLASSLVR